MSVYFIYELSQGRKALKIGRSGDRATRLRQLQTGNPNELLIVGWINAEDDSALERSLHMHFADQRRIGEWFEIEPADIQAVILRAGRNGFVAKNEDAFAIVGYDRDAIPEYAGVWEWGDLELEECCPFCGCCGGMHFNEAASMWHCLNCDTLTEFDGGGIER